MYVELLNSQLHVWMLPIVLFLSSTGVLTWADNCNKTDSNSAITVVQHVLGDQPSLIVAGDFNIENFSISKEYKNMLIFA